MERRPTIQILLLAVASLAIYIFAFVRPYNLLDWWKAPQLTIAKIAGYDPIAGVMYAVAIAALFALYWVASRIVRGQHRAVTWIAILAGAIAFNAAMLFLYPVDSSDVFDNIMHARMQTVYGANPFYQAPIEFQSDPFYPYIGWIFYQTAYGPLWEIIAEAATRLAGDGILANVLAFKVVSIAAYALAVLFIGLTLRRDMSDRVLAGMTLFAWNPLVIFSVAGNGHNDAVMVLFVILGLYFFARGRFTLAALAQTAAALVKFVPALIVPIILIGAMKRLADWRIRARYAITTLASCAAFAVATYAPFWRGGDILGADRRVELLTTSIPALIEGTLDADWGLRLAARVASRIALVLIAAWTIRQMRWVWRDGDVTRASISALLFYLLVSVLWFQPWYVVWVVALGALVRDQTWGRGSVLFSFAAMWKMPIFDFVMGVRPGFVPPVDWRELRITLATLGAPWLYFIAHKIVRRHESNLALGRQTTRARAN